MIYLTEAKMTAMANMIINYNKLGATYDEKTATFHASIEEEIDFIEDFLEKQKIYCSGGSWNYNEKEFSLQVDLMHFNCGL